MADQKRTCSLEGASKVFSILCENCEKNTACVRIPKNETVDSETVCLCSVCFQDDTVLQGNLLGYYFNGARCVHHCSDCELYDEIRRKNGYAKCPTCIRDGWERAIYCENCPTINSMVEQILANSSCELCNIKRGPHSIEQYDFLIEGHLICSTCVIRGMA
jgi:hypothetical protein